VRDSRNLPLSPDSAGTEEHDQMLRAVFDNARDGLLVTDDSRRVLEANPAACSMLGLAPTALVGAALDGLVVAEPAELDALWDVLLETGDTIGEWHFHHADGTVRELEVAATPGFLPGRNLLVLRDVTERRRLELWLHQSQKMEAIGKLAGGVAHDFNNLLTVILGSAELAAARLDDSVLAREQLQGIRVAAERAASLTGQLLAFSRRQVLDPKVVDANEIVSDTAELLERLIPENVELVAHIDPAAGRVRVDPGQLVQVLLNLAVNARDAMPYGGRLTIETGRAVFDDAYRREHPVAAPGRYVLLAVSDTGHGMDAETRERIFEPFFTTKEQGSGTGLGLATVYGIVKQSGGYIWVYSEPGCGTTFKIYLPLVESESEPLCPVAEDSASERGWETVLLVEDEHLVRDIGRAMLEDRGYTVLTAGDAREALAIAASFDGTIDLLLTDVMLPGSGGRELAERLVTVRPELRVLYTSGYTEEAIAHRGLLEPGIRLLPKPFSGNELARKVRETLES
jgi:PAS domain S-box-containing protein